MIKYLSRKMVYALSVLLSLFFLGYSLPSLEEFRNALVREYFSHKEFLFNLKNAPRDRKKAVDERDIQNILSGVGVKAERISRTESGLELKISELSWERIPYLIKELERRYEIVSFSAVDNTGKGLFNVRIVLR